MKCIRGLIIWSLLSSSALAQNGNIDNTGACNANISGTGNNVKLYCSDGAEPQPPQDVFLVIGSSSGVAMVDGMINWQFVNSMVSQFAVQIDQQWVVNSLMQKVFEDQQITLKRGQHFYRIYVNFIYTNGFQSAASCSGVLDAQVSASIIPIIALAQNPMNGDISPINCGFRVRF